MWSRGYVFARKNVVVTAIGIVGLVVAGCGERRKSAIGTPVSRPADEVIVLRGLLRHQNAAVQILQLCQSRASRPELKQACSNGFEFLQKRRAQIVEWERVWFGQDGSETDHDDQYKSFYDRMRNAHGDDFDEAAARAIRVHAREGLAESAACQARAAHDELKQFCADLNAAQNRALDNARRWICEWFRDCAESQR